MKGLQENECDFYPKQDRVRPAACKEEFIHFKVKSSYFWVMTVLKSVVKSGSNAV